jgi:hypothetical protein
MMTTDGRLADLLVANIGRNGFGNQRIQACFTKDLEHFRDFIVVRTQMTLHEGVLRLEREEKRIKGQTDRIGNVLEEKSRATQAKVPSTWKTASLASVEN